MFTGTAIKSDPAYMGGLVGFALVGGETHYTNPAYDTLCSACNPPGHWITALIYASTKTANAYYICFEDGGTSSSGWNNDGDFNDDVFFVTGISCEGGGVPCDTGKPGICAAGLTQCGPNGTTCQQLNQPGPEKCNGLDDDCNGMVDDGPGLCPTGEVCQMGTCVASCQSGELVCLPGKVCDSAGYCVDPACATVTCPAGQVCEAGTCKGPCDGVVCPSPQVCRVGACVDPCAGVTCAAGQVCEGGVCVQSCNCQPCATSLACDATSGQCVDPSCVGVTCAAGHALRSGHADGHLRRRLHGRRLPDGPDVHVRPLRRGDERARAARGGWGGSTGVSFVGVGGFGGTGNGSGGKGGASTGSSGHAGGAGGAGGSGAGSNGKCSCRAVGDGGNEGAYSWAALAMACVAASRRRRR